MAEYAIPGGPEKDTPLPEATTKTIEWWAGTIAKNLASGTSRYPDRDKPLLAAMQAELAQRGGGQPPAPNGGRTAVATQRPALPAVEFVAGAFREAEKATAALQRASQVAHLVAPATVCATLPEGCELAVSAVVIDVANETYNITGKRGLGKSALDRIAAAAGVSWDPKLSCRLDDHSDPRYCHFRAVGVVRSFDGQVRVLCGEVEVDARDGSPQIEEIITKARNAKDTKGNSKPRDPAGQILELRKFLLRHAESKARNRAIRSLGVRTSYDPDELRKPFVVAKLMFTGYSDDPEARREFRSKIADSFLGATRAMYGESTSQPALPPPHRPPAIEHRPHEVIDVEPTATARTEKSESQSNAGPEDPPCPCPDGPGGTHLDGCPYGDADAGERY